MRTFTHLDVENEVRRRFPDVASFSAGLRCALADDVVKEWNTTLPCGHSVYDHVVEFGPQMAELMSAVPLTLIALVMGELDGPKEPKFSKGQRVIYRHKGVQKFARVMRVVEDGFGSLPDGDPVEYVIRLLDGAEYVDVATAESDLIEAPLSDEEKYGR